MESKCSHPSTASIQILSVTTAHKYLHMFLVCVLLLLVFVLKLWLIICIEICKLEDSRWVANLWMLPPKNELYYLRRKECLPEAGTGEWIF